MEVGTWWGGGARLRYERVGVSSSREHPLLGSMFCCLLLGCSPPAR